MAEGFDDMEMQDLGEKYPEYDDMGLDDLDHCLANQTNVDRLTEIEKDKEEPNNSLLGKNYTLGEKMEYIDRLRDERSKDRQTVTIARKNQRRNSAPEVSYQIPQPKARVRRINIPKIAVEDFIRKNYKENFRFSPDNEREFGVRLNIDRTGHNNISYRPITERNEIGAYKIVLKRDSNGNLQYNDAKNASEAVKQFKQEIQEIVKEYTDRENTTREMPMIDTSIQIDDIPGLTPDEMREYRGVMNPTENMLSEHETRQRALQIQAKDYQKEIDKTKNGMKEFKDRKQLENEDDLKEFGEYNELQERLNGLEKARGGLLDQKQREEVRNQQEEDITRLQKFKWWAKENMVGLTALSVSIAGIITTLIIGARKAIVAGAQATSRFGKAIADLGKKLWPLLGPILGLIGTAIFWGAAGLAWLASNLWILAVAFAWFIYDQYKQNKT